MTASLDFVEICKQKREMLMEAAKCDSLRAAFEIAVAFSFDKSVDTVVSRQHVRLGVRSLF